MLNKESVLEISNLLFCTDAQMQKKRKKIYDQKN